MKMIKSAMALTMLVYGSASYASTSQSGSISAIITNAQGVLFFNHSGSRTGIPACGANIPQRWVIDGTTPAGQLQAAQLITAYSLHKKIDINGLNNCNLWGDTETVEHVTIDD